MLKTGMLKNRYAKNRYAGEQYAENRYANKTGMQRAGIYAKKIGHVSLVSRTYLQKMYPENRPHVLCCQNICSESAA